MTTNEKIDRLNTLSKSHALLPDEYIPWGRSIEGHEIYLPDFLFSLGGTALERGLTESQTTRLKVLEGAQVMATYAFSEAVGCLFFNELLVKAEPTSAEGKYLVNMITEELRHQYMFTRMIEQMGVKAQPVPYAHRVLSNLYSRVLGKRTKLLLVLAIEQVADVYAKHFRQSPAVYSVIRKVSELHHIEEGRHMTYQKICLDRFIHNAGFVRRTWFGAMYIFTIWFMRSQYIRKAFFEEVGVSDPKRYYKVAVRNYRKIFAAHCLGECLDYSKSLGHVNFITRPLWRIILKVKP
jgi:hypothetical protein